AAAAQHQPGLVAVPERRDRVHHLVALVLLPGEREQDSNAEIEAVEDHIHHDRETDDGGPDDRKVPFHQRPPSSASRPVSCAAETGRTGVPCSGGSTARPAGPRWIRRLM